MSDVSARNEMEFLSSFERYISIKNTQRER